MSVRTTTVCALLATAVIAVTPFEQASAGLLDRIKRKAEEATEAVREVNDDIESLSETDERAEAQATSAVRAADRELEARTDVEGRTRSAVQSSELAGSARAIEQDANQAQADADRIATTDERAIAELELRQQQTEREVQAAVDIEARSRNAVRGSEAARTINETEREIDNVAHSDDRARAEARSRVRQASSGVDDSERALTETKQALEELGDELN